MLERDIVSAPLSDYTAMVERGTPFAFSRWGDGEWQRVLGLGGDRQPGDLAVELRTILAAEPAYRLAVRPSAAAGYGRLIHRYLYDRDLDGLRWYDADVFDRADAAAFDGFLEAVRDRRLIVAAPGFTRGPLRELVECSEFVEVPAYDGCYLQINDVVRRLLAAASRGDEPAVVLLSCGPATAAVVHRVYEGRHTLVDVGRVWESRCPPAG
jgi:hypothetical protein